MTLGDVKVRRETDIALTPPHKCAVRGVRVVALPAIADSRGTLSFANVEEQLPFVVRRYFLLYDLAGGAERGDHAHRALQQFIVCVAGSCELVADDGTNRETLSLDRPEIGVDVAPMTWVTVRRASPDAVVMVLASDVYDAGDYIRDYAEFRALTRIANS